MSDFNFTGLCIFCMLIYGFIAIFNESITFEWKLAGGITLFVFILEMIADNV